MTIEFRLYYDENGNVVCYSGEPLEIDYDFIVVDTQVFAEGRPDVRVVNGKVTRPKLSSGTIKLVQSDEGVSCSIDDISIVTTMEETQKWKLKINES